MNEPTIGPNFFVVGAPKAGTTTLYRYLAGHPPVFVAPIKEPNHFCPDLHPHAASSTLNDRLPLDIEAYLAADERRPVQVAWIESRKDYLRLFEPATNVAVRGECSTSYLYSAAAAAEIAAFNPQARVIALLRDPATRAYSHYLMDRRIGITTRTFREEIERELADTRACWSTSRLYLGLGRYAEQLARYFRVFPSDRILVLFSDELLAEPDTVLGRVAVFLGVDPFAPPSTAERANPAALPRFRHLNRILHQTRIKRHLRAVLPGGVKSAIRSWYFRGNPEAGLAPEDRARVIEILRPDIDQLSEMLARDLSAWIPPQTCPDAVGGRG